MRSMIEVLTKPFDHFRLVGEPFGTMNRKVQDFKTNRYRTERQFMVEPPIINALRSPRARIASQSRRNDIFVPQSVSLIR
jgi:hypothetical protein